MRNWCSTVVSFVLGLTIAWPALALTVQEAPAPPAGPAKLYEAGEYAAAADQVRQRLEEGEVPPGDIYWAAQALLRADRVDEARALLERLGGGDDDPWTAIRQAAVALSQGASEPAVEHAARAAELAPDLFFAHYQLGLVRNDRQEWPQAAAAFDRAAALDGTSAYAHYYAGLAYNRLKRIDPMAVHFRRFLDLAPSAPERAQVEQLLKLLKGLR